jgi:hypothetical protein
MALSANTEWEVRATGSNTNGGGFVNGASGTDWTQQDSPQYSVTDGVANGTTTITSATANFGTDVVGNIVYVSGGTGSITAGWYQITSRTNSTTIVLDRSTGLTAGTGVTLKIGGAFATLSQVFTVVVASNTVWVKSGSYSISTGLTTGSTGNDLPNTAPDCLLGYNTTRGDCPTGSSRPTISTSSSIVMLSFGSNNLHIENFILDGGGVATKGIVLSSDRGNIISNCKVTNCTTMGIQGAGGNVNRCEVTGMTSGATAAFYMNADNCIDCYAHDNTCTGFSCDGSDSGSIFVRCISANNSGASSDGFASRGTLLGASCMLNCVSYNNGRHGLYVPGNYASMSVNNCVFVKNGDFGISWGVVLKKATLDINYNAFGTGSIQNTSGLRSNVIAGINDITITANPFTDPDNGDFSLNNTANGGTSLRAAGYPGVMPGATTTGYMDIGAIQHQDAGSVSLYQYIPLFVYDKG